MAEAFRAVDAFWKLRSTGETAVISARYLTRLTFGFAKVRRILGEGSGCVDERFRASSAG